MQRLKPVEPSPCVTDRERPGNDGHVFLELWARTAHCYYYCYYIDCYQHTQLSYTRDPSCREREAQQTAVPKIKWKRETSWPRTKNSP